METAQILESTNTRTVELTITADADKAQNESDNNDRCKNGVCLVAWKPQRPAA